MKESYNTINVDEENYEELNDGLKKSNNPAEQITNSNVEDKSNTSMPDDIFEDIKTKNEFAMNIYNQEKDDDKKKLWRKGKKVTKADFANFMRTARGGKEVTQCYIQFTFF